MVSLAHVLIPVALLSSTVLSLSAAAGLQKQTSNSAGEVAATGQFPHHASVQLWRPTTEFKHVCGGAIISDRFVLTSAQCQDTRKPDASLYRILVGKHYRNTDDGAKYAVKRWIVHDDYYMNQTRHTLNMRNDIALVETALLIKFSNVVSPIAIDHRIVNGGVHAVTSGWGLVKTAFQSVLKYGDVVTLDNETCRKRHLQVPANLPIVDWDTICVTTNIDFCCQSDWGGPLVADNKLIGIMSWRFACGPVPQGFTRISTYINWINQKTNLVF